MKLLIVVNPISGGVNKNPFLKKAEQTCKKYGIDLHIFKTTGNEDEKKLKETVDKFSPDRVASVGGDGTTLFTAISLMNTDIPFGIVPMGSANGMAAELFVNLDPTQAFQDIIMSDLFGRLDIIKVNGEHYSIHIGDVGINAQLVNSYEKDPKRGMATYAKYFIDELNKVKPFDIKIDANGKSENYTGVMIGICNSRKYGTGVPLNLKGNPMDGKFELVIIKYLDAGTLLNAGLSKFHENFLKDRNQVVISTDKAKVTFDKPRLLQLDGEVIDSFNELNIEIVKNAVNLITTADNQYLK